ncbi:MAG: hypothetical protein ACFWUE_07205 [Xylanivirga thermophila]|jgi:hypothetical protein|uniref:hypothetical protein n=1 Tax=Xylanivirga thermophila TaxID=2496273 RepID=UPI0039F45D1B
MAVVIPVGIVDSAKSYPWINTVYILYDIMNNILSICIGEYCTNIMGSTAILAENSIFHVSNFQVHSNSI